MDAKREKIAQTQALGLSAGDTPSPTPLGGGEGKGELITGCT